MNLADLKKSIIKSKPPECACVHSSGSGSIGGSGGGGGGDSVNDDDEEKSFAEVVEMVSRRILKSYTCYKYILRWCI